MTWTLLLVPLTNGTPQVKARPLSHSLSPSVTAGSLVEGNQSPPRYGLMATEGATEGSAAPAGHTHNAASVSQPTYHLPPHNRGSAKRSSPPQTQPAPQSRPAATGSAATGPAPPGSPARDRRHEQQARQTWVSARQRTSVHTQGCGHRARSSNSLVFTHYW